MGFRKLSIAGLALAVGLALSPLPELRAATLFGHVSQPTTDNLVHSAQATKKKVFKKAGKRKAGKRKKGKRGAGKGKSCGTYMYRKGGKCLDARNKK
jgi:hypothetical protein